MQNTVVEHNLGAIQSLMQKHRIKKGYLFGSSVKGNFSKDSDIDVLVEVDETIEPVELGEHLWDLQFELQHLLGHEVDLVTTRSLRNPIFIQELNETRLLIYG
jgi:predicted nucleotidyltransferase